jgi:SH3 domain protein
MKRLSPCLMVILLLCGANAGAETAYVTDLLRLGLHRAEDTSDRAFRTLQSGQELEILSRTTNYARVRLPDGTEGYVKVAYLVDEKPAALVVDEVRAEGERLRAELADLEAAFAEPAARIRTLEADVERLTSALADATATSDELESINERLQSRAERYKFSLPYSWVAACAAICLIAGFLFGLWLFDYRSRQRHGGIRIY